MPAPYKLDGVRDGAKRLARTSKYGGMVYALIYVGDCIRSLSEKEHDE